MRENTSRIWLGLAGWIAVTFVAAALGSQFEPGEWYEQLAKPPWTAPTAAFGPVWSALYLMMAVAAWLVWRQGGFRAARTALALYLLQLVVNTAWSWLFFELHAVAIAMAVIILLIGLAVTTTVLFWRRTRLAGLLLLPYLLWLGYAGALNYAIWRLNVAAPAALAPPMPPADTARAVNVAAGTQTISERAVIYVEASEAELAALRTDVATEDYYAISDDFMYYRATAYEFLTERGLPVTTLTGKRPLVFMVNGAPRRYDLSDVSTLDVIVLYDTGRQPRIIAPIDVHEAAEYFKN